MKFKTKWQNLCFSCSRFVLHLPTFSNERNDKMFNSILFTNLSSATPISSVILQKELCRCKQWKHTPIPRLDVLRILCWMHFIHCACYHKKCNCMHYGAYYGITYNSFTSMDIVGHEDTHSVVECTAGLLHSKEAGAISMWHVWHYDWILYLWW